MWIKALALRLTVYLNDRWRSYHARNPIGDRVCVCVWAFRFSQAIGKSKSETFGLKRPPKIFPPNMLCAMIWVDLNNENRAQRQEQKG